jgi:hypothetical protein
MRSRTSALALWLPLGLGLALPVRGQAPARPPSFWSVGASASWSIAVSYTRNTVWLYGSAVGGPFAFHADSLTMAGWADSAAAIRSATGGSARLTGYDSLLHADVVMELTRLTNDSLGPYEYLATVGNWRGVIVLPYDSAQRLFTLMHGKPMAVTPSDAGVETYFDFQVEKQAGLLPSSGQPVYPVPLRLANVSGEVLGQFVVDTTGLADISTFKPLKSTNLWFTASVLGALPKMRFKPAEIKGRKVRELVQQPYAFNVAR